jgi:hypothetical protein
MHLRTRHVSRTNEVSRLPSVEFQISDFRLKFLIEPLRDAYGGEYLETWLGKRSSKVICR